MTDQRKITAPDTAYAVVASYGMYCYYDIVASEVEADKFFHEHPNAAYGGMQRLTLQPMRELMKEREQTT